MTVAKKRIVIKSSGPIWCKGGVYGPITIPYVEEVGEILKMIAAGLKVYEVVDGKEIELTIMNYDQEVDPDTMRPASKKSSKREEAKKEEAPKAEVKVESIPAEDKKESVEVETEETMEVVGEKKEKKHRK